MKELLRIQGGYPRQMDYLLNMQTELLTMGNSLFKGLGIDLALSGCEVTDNKNGTVNIAAGVVYIDGEIFRFDGVANLAGFASKTLVKGSALMSDEKEFADQLTKQVYREVKAVVADKTTSKQILIKTSNLYNLRDYINDNVANYALKGEIKQVYDFDSTFMTNFDSSGLGITPRWNGWALMNGNNGTPDFSGRMLLGAGRFTDPVTGLQTIYNNGDKAGEKTHKLTINEMPKHNHNIIQGLAGQSYSANSGTSRNSVDATDLITSSAGGDQPHNNMPPYLVAFFVIKIA